MEEAIRGFTQAYINTPVNQPYSPQSFGQISTNIGKTLATSFNPHIRSYKVADAGSTNGMCMISIPEDVIGASGK